MCVCVISFVQFSKGQKVNAKIHKDYFCFCPKNILVKGSIYLYYVCACYLLFFLKVLWDCGVVVGASNVVQLLFEIRTCVWWFLTSYVRPALRGASCAIVADAQWYCKCYFIAAAAYPCVFSYVMHNRLKKKNVYTE